MVFEMKIQKSDFVFKECGPEYIDEIMHIQDVAFENMDNTATLRKNSREMLLSCLSEPHYTLGAFVGDELAAFIVLYVAGNSNENLGRDAGIPEESLDTVANVKLVIVLPKYRGNGLQRMLTEKLESVAKTRGFKTLCCTVSPENTPSIRNFEACGYKFYQTKEKYDGLLRNIYYKEI